MEACFVTSAFDLAGRPQPARPEFAFIGRSNCGKSSLINLFLGRTRLAQTSGTPGRTRALNYYLVRQRYYLVDLPGYGFARAGQQERRRWQALVRSYLEAGDRPLAVFHLLDARHRPTVADLQMSRWLRESGRPLAVAVTKVDKVPRSRLAASYRRIITALELPPGTPFIPTSALKRMGREEMQAWVEARLAAWADPAAGWPGEGGEGGEAGEDGVGGEDGAAGEGAPEDPPGAVPEGPDR